MTMNNDIMVATMKDCHNFEQFIHVVVSVLGPFHVRSYLLCSCFFHWKIRECAIIMCKLFPKMCRIKPAFSSGKFKRFGLNAIVQQHILVGCRYFSSLDVVGNTAILANTFL